MFIYSILYHINYSLFWYQYTLKYRWFITTSLIFYYAEDSLYFTSSLLLIYSKTTFFITSSLFFIYPKIYYIHYSFIDCSLLFFYISFYAWFLFVFTLKLPYLLLLLFRFWFTLNYSIFFTPLFIFIYSKIYRLFTTSLMHIYPKDEIFFTP